MVSSLIVYDTTEFWLSDEIDIAEFWLSGSIAPWSFGSAASMTPLSHGAPLSFDSVASSAIWNLNRLGCESVALGRHLIGKKLSCKILWDYPCNQWLGCLLSILFTYTVYMIFFPPIFIHILWRYENKYVYSFLIAINFHFYPGMEGRDKKLQYYYILFL